PGAQPEMRLLAEAMRDARDASIPKLLQPGEWHLPYVADLPVLEDGVFTLPTGDSLAATDLGICLSVARCARVSYLTHEGKAPNLLEDLSLYDRLLEAEPLHASPAEHQATPDILDGEPHALGSTHEIYWQHKHEHGNFVGWRQYRKLLPNEC